MFKATLQFIFHYFLPSVLLIIQLKIFSPYLDNCINNCTVKNKHCTYFDNWTFNGCPCADDSVATLSVAGLNLGLRGHEYCLNDRLSSCLLPRFNSSTQSRGASSLSYRIEVVGYLKSQSLLQVHLTQHRGSLEKFLA